MTTKEKINHRPYIGNTSWTLNQCYKEEHKKETTWLNRKRGREPYINIQKVKSERLNVVFKKRDKEPLGVFPSNGYSEGREIKNHRVDS
jgi:hypothetical protein